MKRLFATALAIALLAVTPPAMQCLSHDDIVQQVAAGQLTWKTSEPAGWTGDHHMTTWTDFTTYIANGGSCVKPAGSAFALMSWSQMVASGCATNHTASQQTDTVAGSYSTVYYDSSYNSVSQLYTCLGPYGSDSYSGTPVTLPAGTVAPTSSGTQLALSLSGITWSGSTSLAVTLYNPSGSQVSGPWAVSSPNSTLTVPPYYAVGAAAGAWYWQITQSGGADGTCNDTYGASGGGMQVQWSATATFYE